MGQTTATNPATLYKELPNDIDSQIAVKNLYLELRYTTNLNETSVLGEFAASSEISENKRIDADRYADVHVFGYFDSNNLLHTSNQAVIPKHFEDKKALTIMNPDADGVFYNAGFNTLELKEIRTLYTLDKPDRYADVYIFKKTDTDYDSRDILYSLGGELYIDSECYYYPVSVAYESKGWLALEVISNYES